MVEIKNENCSEFKIGDKVWWYDSWGTLQNGKISEFKGEYVAIKTGVHAQKAEYIESIKDVNDLVQFLFDHDVSGEDHDCEAEEAARERAKDLLELVIK